MGCQMSRISQMLRLGSILYREVIDSKTIKRKQKRPKNNSEKNYIFSLKKKKNLQKNSKKVLKLKFLTKLIQNKSKNKILLFFLQKSNKILNKKITTTKSNKISEKKIPFLFVLWFVLYFWVICLNFFLSDAVLPRSHGLSARRPLDFKLMIW